MKVVFVVSDGPRTCINLDLSHCVSQHPRFRTVKALLTPFGTQCPSMVAPGEVRGNPCDPGGYILSPSEITACRYGSCCADMAVISLPSLYRPRISCCILWYASGFFSRKYVTAAKNVETVSPPAMLSQPLSARFFGSHRHTSHLHQCGCMGCHFFLADFTGFDLLRNVCQKVLTS